MIWHLSNRFDPRAVAVADRHYSRQKPGTPQFMPTGSCVVFYAAVDGREAVWGTKGLCGPPGAPNSRTTAPIPYGSRAGDRFSPKKGQFGRQRSKTAAFALKSRKTAEITKLPKIVILRCSGFRFGTNNDISSPPIQRSPTAMLSARSRKDPRPGGVGWGGRGLRPPPARRRVGRARARCAGSHDH